MNEPIDPKTASVAINFLAWLSFGAIIGMTIIFGLPGPAILFIGFLCLVIFVGQYIRGRIDSDYGPMA